MLSFGGINVASLGLLSASLALESESEVGSVSLGLLCGVALLVAVVGSWACSGEAARCLIVLPSSCSEVLLLLLLLLGVMLLLLWVVVALVSLRHRGEFRIIRSIWHCVRFSLFASSVVIVHEALKYITVGVIVPSQSRKRPLRE